MPSAIQSLGWALRPLAFMDRCQRHYGEIFTLRVRQGRPWVFLTNPEHVKRVFTTDAALMPSGMADANPLLEPLLGPRSVMLLDEPDHMSDRRHLLPSFHGRRMREYGEMISEVARREIATWPAQEPFELWPRMQEISLAVMLRAVFGAEESEHLDPLRRRLGDLTDWFNSPRRLALLAAVGARSVNANTEFRAVMEPVEELLLEEVRRRRARREEEGRGEDGGGGGDILSALDAAHNGPGTAIDERKMRDELVTMLSDGPTATSMAWAFERLLRHPDKLARLREEVLGGESEQYADAVVRETLRLCPAAPVVMRRLLEPMRLGGYTLAPQTIVAPCVFLVHRRADIYPQPRSFQPERFLERAPGTYTWIPFGGGVRRCVAASMAQLEIKKVIQTVIEEVELRPVESRSEGASRSSVSFVPDRGARVVARRRTQAGSVLV